jgi:hypothetical protein
MLVRHWFDNASAVETGRSATAVEVPFGAKELLDQYRMPGL